MQDKKKAPAYKNLPKTPLLQRAWKKVQAKGSRGGIDGVGLKEFAEHRQQELEKLRRELAAGNYRPQPYLNVEIPKNESEKRRLGMLSVRDKVVQQAVLFLIHDTFDRTFLGSSYAYRPKKGHQRAVRRVRHLIQHQKLHCFVREDIDNFFDNLDHTRLESALRSLVTDPALADLILLLVKMGRVTPQLAWEDVTKGVPQGGLLSPILSNLYLHPLDDYMTRFTDIGYIRYGDDFLLLCPDMKRALAMSKKLRAFIPKHLGLSLNPEGQMGEVKKGVEYLGITFFPDRMDLSGKKRKEIEGKIRAATKLRQGRFPRHFQQVMGGLARYYGRVLPEEILKWMDQCQFASLRPQLEKFPDNARGRKSRKAILRQLRFFSAEHQDKRAQLIADWLGKRKGAPAGEVRIQMDKVIRSRKNEYQKRFTASLELVVNRPGVFLGISRNGISVRQGGETLETMPAANLRFISIVSKGVSLSSNLVLHCARHEVPIVFFGRDGKPAAGLRNFERRNVPRLQAQVRGLENGKAEAFARAIVAGKLRNQANLLKYYAKYYRERDAEYAEALDKSVEDMEEKAKEAKAFQAVDLATLRQELLQLEAGAAKRYWDLVRIMIDDEVDFPGRLPQGAKDVANALLNYGYGILYQRIHDALLRVGIDPAISYLHVPTRGKPTLTYDLIEEFRQRAVDAVVFSMINRGENFKLAGGFLNGPSRKRLAEKVLERLNSAEKFRGQRITLGEVIRLQARNFAHFVEGQLPSYKPYRLKW